MTDEREAERLRQERETFEVQKSQSRWWFGLRFATATTLLALAIGVFGISALIILSPDRYSPDAVLGSGFVMLLDLAALVGAALSALLKPSSQPSLSPVTHISDRD